jgi:hypothetical protein
MKEEQCYWCGAPATSREHVPSNGLFPAGYKKNLITVPACTAHNNSLGEVDEKVRVLLQATESNQIAKDAWNGKTLRGLKRSPAFATELAESSVPIHDADGSLLGGVMRADGTLLQPYFEKTTRGLYYHITRKPSMEREVRYYSRYYFSHDDVEKVDMLDRGFRDIASETGPGENPEVFQWRYILSDGFFIAEMNFYEGVVVYGLIKLDM